SLIPLDREVLAALVDDVIAKLANIRLLDNLDFLALRSLGCCLLFGFVFTSSTVVLDPVSVTRCRRRLGQSLDYERRLHVRFDLLEFRDQLAAFRARRELPADNVFRAVLVDEAHFPQVVLFVEARFYTLEAFVFLHLLEFFFQPLDFLWRSLLV